MLPYGDSRLTRIVLSVFFLLVIIYAYYEARGFLYGPSINIPSDVTVAHDPFVTIRGTADRIAGLYMNGKPVPVTEGGAFDEPYLLAIGYNRIVLQARDKYGRERERVIEIIYQPDAASSNSSASSSAPAVAPNQ
ncbi:hypothetical protein A3F27_03310 [Candidatus Kaiserbacteria bacterium RIFCSPHIGHO2_12_FULL_53_13]|uniref:Uncharacterized protein n=1 Tax=Candidatus Kaiserbacteria bacterium RIFCSPHIGHO2_12_FULL_53_13 TaxID=1798502 RepID=A0A1F6E8S7_9BACT|nr:MAG: hypothetical protein A3F27_03310 [Candidatus Kaiserbacteria bacterium RIFCSPHIGHO2_12_FULL_53_13]OGG74349.1 MAG: hypothetical protein A3A37_02610 [Candidatus Kaiserbacteria bacterium RIFCSPLOWO2_01_FULL_52_36]